jgi:hypothetical protein
VPQPTTLPRETNKCIQNLKRKFTLGELGADRKIILQITEKAVYKIRNGSGRTQ